MSLKTKLIAGGVAAVLGLGLVRYCDRVRVVPTEPGKLAPNERERVEVKGHKVTVIKADKTMIHYAPDGAKVRINKDGSVNVEIKKFGFMREGGLGTSWNGDRLKLAVDLKFAYYRRLGLHVGTAYDPTQKRFKDIARPLLFLSYAVPHDNFANTSLWVGTELFPQRLAGGIRLAF